MILDIGCGYRPGGDVNVDVIVTPYTDVVCSAEALPFKDESFDKVRSYHVVEHCTNPVKVILEAVRVARKATIVTPSAHHPEFLFHYLFRRGFWVDESDHVYCWTPRYMANLLRRLGLSFRISGDLRPARIKSFMRNVRDVFNVFLSWCGIHRDIKVEVWR